MDGNEIGDLYLATVVVNVQDMARAVEFWTRALGYVRRDAEWGPNFNTLFDPAGRRPSISLQLTDAQPQQPVRVHLDLYTSEQSRHVERLIALGATRPDSWPYPAEPDFVVLRDPDGNEFCVIDLVEL